MRRRRGELGSSVPPCALVCETPQPTARAAREPSRALGCYHRARPMARPPLERLCQSLQQSADDERRRLARTLHDAAAQTLSAAAMSLSLVELEAAALSPAGRR